MNKHIDAAVSRLLEARRGKEAVATDFIAAHPLTIRDGLEVRARIQAQSGPVGAWKIAPSSSLESPNFGPIFAKDVYDSPARFARGSLRNAGIECEIAFRIGRDLTEPPYTHEQIADAIDSLVPLIEITDSRLANHNAASEGWRLADFVSNGAVVVGASTSDWRSVNTQQQSATLTFNGKIVGEAAGNPNPDLVAVVQLLTDQVGRHCGGVRAGQVVTTGSLFGSIPVGPGVEAVARFPGLGELRVILES